MIAYLCKRLAWAFLVLLGITGIVFVVVHLSGDPAALYMGPEGTKERPRATSAARCVTSSRPFRWCSHACPPRSP